MGAIRQRKRWVFSLGGTCLTTKCTLHRVSYSCTLACIYERAKISFFLVLTWHMNCSVSRLRRGTMLVLLVVPPPASSHITDSRSITRALQRTWWELFLLNEEYKVNIWAENAKHVSEMFTFPSPQFLCWRLEATPSSSCRTTGFHQGGTQPSSLNKGLY